MSVGMPQGIWLTKFGAIVADYFGHACYHVGSSLRTKEWRDVDVRLLMPDDEFEHPRVVRRARRNLAEHGGTAPMTETADPQQRLHDAVRALVEPVQRDLDRDHRAARQLVEQEAVEHRGHIQHLRLRLDRARDPHDVERVHCAMRQAGARHRDRRASLIAATTATAAVEPPLIERLEAAVYGTGGTNGGAAAPKHQRSAIGLAAAELLHQIRAELGHRDGDLANALRAWRPGDVQAAADAAHRWAADGRAILEPTRGFELTRPCPACGERFAWVTEDGEHVRRAALYVNTDAQIAVCMASTRGRACGTTWPRERWALLVAALETEDRPDATGRRQAE